MLIRAARVCPTLPLRRQAIGPLGRRLVTTDAASSHAEREHVPKVSGKTFRIVTKLCAEHISRQDDDQPFEVRLSDESFETYELDPPPYTLQVTKRSLKQIYHDMVSIRYVYLVLLAARS